MQELAKSQKAFLVNPAVGVRTSSCLFSSYSREQCVHTLALECVCVCVQPEAISGSSRMKGGSVTKILLEVVLSAAHAATFTNTPVTYMWAWRKNTAMLPEGSQALSAVTWLCWAFCTLLCWHAAAETVLRDSVSKSKWAWKHSGNMTDWH